MSSGCGSSALLGLGGLASAQDRLDDLLLLDEESAHNSLAHALGAARAAISARHAALALLQRLQRMGADGGQLFTAKTTAAHAAATNGEGASARACTSDEQYGRESAERIVRQSPACRSNERSSMPAAALDGNSIRFGAPADSS